MIIIAIAIVNTKRDINWEFNKNRIIWFILNGSKTVAIIVVHYGEFDAKICKMN